MPIADPFQVEPGSFVDVNVDGVVRTARVFVTRALGQSVSSAEMEFVADSVAVPAGSYVVTSGAPAPGQLRIVQATSSSVTTLNATFDAGTLHRTPITLSAWGLESSGLWSYIAADDKLTITTAVARSQSGSIPLGAKPSAYDVIWTDALALPITCDLYLRGFLENDDYGVLPDLTFGSAGTGVRHRTTANVGVLTFPATSGAGLKVVFSSRATGGIPATSVVHNHYLTF